MTRPARKMKPSGIPWIGDVPTDWEICRLSSIGDFSASGIDKKIIEGEPLVRIVNYTDVYGNSSARLREKEYMLVSAPAEKIIEHQVQEGDLIFTPSSETLDDIGVSAVVDEQLENTAFSYHVLRFKFRRKVCKDYKRYLCNNFYVLAFFSSRATGSIRKTLSRRDFRECPILLPPEETQKKIAEFLDEKCAEIDALIAVEEKMIAELKSYKQSVITEAVTRGVPDAANASRPLKDSGIPWLGSVPAHWEIRMIKRIFHVFSGTTPKSENPNYWDGPFSWITPADYKTPDKYVSSGRKNLTREGLLSCGLTLLPAGSIIFSKRAPIGAVAIARSELCTNQGCLSCVPRVDLNEEYFYFLMSVFTEQFELLGSGTTFKEISLSDFSKFLLPFPPKSEQCEIVKYLNEESNRINSVISVKQEKITALQNYKKSIIFEYTTGKRES